MNNQEKYQVLKTLREEQPILWAVIRGAQTVPVIAKSLMWAPKDVIEGLSNTPEIKEGSFPGIWEVGPEYVELSEFSKKLFTQIVAWERTHRVQGGLQGLTPKQAGLLDLLSEAFGSELFTTLDAAKAQGYSKAGFTANLLTSLENKGYLESVPSTRPKLWKVIKNRPTARS